MLHKRVYYTKVGLSILQMCKKWIITFFTIHDHHQYVSDR